MLKQALNAVIMLHSRAATLKRLGATTDMYSPCRIMPSNFFRFLRGPESTTIKGVEFVIPLDSLTGEYAQKLTFSAVPDEGTFKIKFGEDTTDDLEFDIIASDLQIALRLLTPLSNIVVAGNFATGFTFLFAGEPDLPEVGEVVESTLMTDEEELTTEWTSYQVPWTDKMKKGDRILEDSALWTVDEIMVLYDLGAQPMGYRVRAD